MIIDFNKQNGGGGSGSGVTPEQVQEQINSALTPYWDSANTESAITAAVSGKADKKILVDFDHTTQAERASVYADLYALYSGGSGATINKTYDFFKTVNTWQGLKIDYYGFSADTLVFGKVVSPENITDQVVYEQVMTIDSAGTVNVVTNTVGGGVSQEYVDSAVTILQNQLDEIDEVIPAAIVDLNERVDEISAATPSIDLSGYYTSAQTEEAISAATSGKADAANVQTYGDYRYFPKWNEQGIITDKIGSTLFETTFPINNEAIQATIIRAGWNLPLPHIYAPTTSGNAGEVLVSLGNGGAPVWSAVTMGGVSQEYVDSAVTILQDQLDEIDEVIPAAIVDLNERVDGFSDIELPISAAVNKLKGDFEARLDQQYYKKQEVNNLLKDKLTAGEADVRIKNYADPLFQAVYETIEDKELPISAALNELNEAIDLIDEVVPAALVNLNETKVGSDSVHTIWRGTQTAYDAITTKDASTLYIIVNE